jgi:hypothetical protein
MTFNRIAERLRELDEQYKLYSNCDDLRRALRHIALDIEIQERRNNERQTERH